MLYTKFKNTLIEDLKAHFSTSKIEEMEIVKSNDRHYDGIVITPKDSNTGLTIYANLLYEEIIGRNSDYASVLRGAISSIESALENVPDTSLFGDFDKVKNHIKIKLVDPKRNSTYLNSIAHTTWNDLAVCFILNLSGNKYITVPNSLCKYWGKTIDDLYKIALKNMEQSSITITDLQSIFGSVAPVPVGSTKVYTLADSSAPFGASALLLKSAMNRCSEILESDELIIIPSSVREVIVLDRKQFRGDVSFISDIIREINSQMDTEDILTDHPYFYDRRMEKFSY